MKWKPVGPAIALVCAILGSATPLLAQAVQTSTLTGTIKDTTGSVLPGVTVNVSSPQQVGGVQTSISDAQGIGEAALLYERANSPHLEFDR